MSFVLVIDEVKSENPSFDFFQHFQVDPDVDRHASRYIEGCLRRLIAYDNILFDAVDWLDCYIYVADVNRPVMWICRADIKNCISDPISDPAIAMLD